MSTTRRCNCCGHVGENVECYYPDDSRAVWYLCPLCRARADSQEKRKLLCDRLEELRDWGSSFQRAPTTASSRQQASSTNFYYWRLMIDGGTRSPRESKLEIDGPLPPRCASELKALIRRWEEEGLI